MGFGELMKVKGFEIRKDMSSWVVDRFESESNVLEVHVNTVNVTKKDVERILGVKSGTIDIGEFLVKGNCEPEIEMELNLQLEEGMIGLANLCEMLLSMGSSDQEFKVKVMLYMIGKFLSPMIKASVRRSWLGLIKSMEKIRELKWEKFIIDSQAIGIRKRKKLNKPGSPVVFTFLW
ncbi:hypothetical protein M9H77_22511 [Catharanthus roseus]|uniref:Uncharacterized protein n=1 Tax=Catharanthus roseus TaxID=4058 RepID=A0ACC0AUR4_CATRO|nr:hypothetical protein M9H77_22511 [Catharanthus roseus]